MFLANTSPVAYALNKALPCVDVPSHKSSPEPVVYISPSENTEDVPFTLVDDVIELDEDIAPTCKLLLINK